MNSNPFINECIAKLAASGTSIETLESKVKGLNSLSLDMELLTVFQWLAASVDVQPWHGLYTFLRVGALAEDAISFVPIAENKYKYFSEVLQISSLAHPQSVAITKYLYKIFEKIRFNPEQAKSFEAAVVVSSEHLDLVHLLPALESLKVGIKEEIEAKILEFRMISLLQLNQYDSDFNSQDFFPSIALSL